MDAAGICRLGIAERVDAAMVRGAGMARGCGENTRFIYSLDAAVIRGLGFVERVGTAMVGGAGMAIMVRGA